VAKRRKNNEEAVSLFPFMSILACLIGILTLMISVSMQAKQAETQGRSEEEKARALENRDLKKQAEAIQAIIRKAEEKLKKDNSASSQLAELKDHRIVLREKLQELSKAKDPAKSDAAIQKTIELLRAEIAALKRDRPPLLKRQEELEKELASRKNPPKKVESVLVKSSGSGVRMAARIFFVECNSTGLVLIGLGDGDKVVATGAIASSADYASFLEEVKRTRDSMVLFLLRKDGSSSYAWAAGIAESKFEVRTGKIPLPNNGKIDLSLFKSK
jgi:predicted RNase H-like nuclease (RuvC/YqgF family)